MGEASRACVIPTLRYRDAARAVEFVCRATQSIYVIVDDVDAHCERARRAGAEVLMEPFDPEHGGRLYTCRDPEGHVWNFGSYDPLAESGT